MVSSEFRRFAIATNTSTRYGSPLLRAEIGLHVARSVAFFLAACRHDGDG